MKDTIPDAQEQAEMVPTARQKAAHQCQAGGCSEDALYEGWYLTRDGLGIPTGTMRRAQVCEAHKGLLSS